MSLMNGMLSEARFAVIVSGENLPMSELNQALALTPTRTMHKGELLNRLPEVHAANDEWVYAIPLTDPIGRDCELNELLDYLATRKEQLQAVKEKYSVKLRMYVQSDYARMTYNLHAGTLRRLNEVGLGLEVSSLSWGETGL